MLQSRGIVSLGLTMLLYACIGTGSIGTTAGGVGGAGGTMGLVSTGGASSAATTDRAPGGGTTAVSSLAAQTLGSCGVSTTGSPSVQTIDVPSALTGANWSAKALICQQGGWDLTQCAGKSATFTTFDSSTTSSSGKPMTIWVASIENTVCCLYAEETSSNGAGYPVPCNRGTGG